MNIHTWIRNFHFIGLLFVLALRSSSAQELSGTPTPMRIPGVHRTSNKLSLVDRRSAVDQPLGDPVEYAYNDKTSLALGRGFDPSDVSAKPKAACINWTSEPLNPGPPSTDFNLVYVNTYEEMNFVLGVDSKVDASYLGASAGSHAKLDTSFLTKKNTITVVLTASTNFGRWGLKAGAVLADPAKAWLSQDSKTFQDRCGSRYVSIEDRGSSVSALITLNSVSNDFKLAFDSEMSGGLAGGPLTGKASIMFHAEAKSAASQDRLQVQVFATGGTGLAGLADTVKTSMKSNTGIEQATQALSSFLGQFHADNAAAVYYRVSSMEDFGWDPNGIEPWTDLKERKLRVLAQEYRRTAHDLDVSNGIVNGSHPLALVMDKTTVDYIKQDILRGQSYLDSLAENHRTCKLNLSSEDPSCDLPSNRVVMTYVELFLTFLDPPRVTIRVLGLSEDQTMIVLNAAPEVRLGYAKQYNANIDGIGASLQTTSPYELSLKVSFLDADGTERDIFVEGPWNNGRGALWYHSPPAPPNDPAWEDLFKKWMASWWGVHSGTVFFTVKDKMHRNFRIAFMNARWGSNMGVITAYEYELVY